MPRSKRAASKEAIKQMQLISSTAYEDDDDDDNNVDKGEDFKILPDTFEVSDDDDIAVDMPPKKKYKLSHRKSTDGSGKENRDVIVLQTVNQVTPDAPEVIGAIVEVMDEATQTLKLEVWDEELEPCQLELHEKVKQELETLESCILRLKNLNCDVVFESENSTAVEVIHTVDNIQNTTISTVPPNLVVTNGGTQNYQLMMDPRLGLIVAPAPQATSSNVIQKTTVTPAAPPPRPSLTPIKKVRSRPTKPSIIKTISTTAPPALTPIVKSNVPQSVITVRGGETSLVGGLASSNKTIKVVNSLKTQTTTVVDLTNDEAPPALQPINNRVVTVPDSREVSFNKLQGKTFPSLVVVARPHLRVKDLNIASDRSVLDAKVKTVLMHVPTKFTEWLIQQGLVRSEQNCSVHANSKLKLGMYSDVSKFPYSGGYVWISECCPHRFVSVFSGSLFEGSPHPPSVILKLIYHWACQTNVQNIVQWVKVDNLYVKGMNSWLRSVCTVALHTHCSLLGGPGKKVEVGVISLGTTTQDGRQRQVKVEVLGLLDTDSKLMRLRAIEPLQDGDKSFRKRFTKILEPLTQWVHHESRVVTDVTVDRATLVSMGFKNVHQTTSSDSVYSNGTIMDYLRRIVPRMFQNTLSLLSRQIIQQFLDELVWREWYGLSASQAFDSLIAHISEQTRAEAGLTSLTNRLNKVSANPFKNWAIYPTSSHVPLLCPVRNTDSGSVNTTKRNVTRPKKISAVIRSSTSPSTPASERSSRASSPDLPERMVSLENYYYGEMEGTKNIATSPITRNIKCCVCQATFSNNLVLMTHLFTHAHSLSSSVVQCRYCLASVSSSEGLERHVNSTHPIETQSSLGGYVCLICETSFTSNVALGKHLSKDHSPAELPYSCATCAYRCSCHRQAVDHFYKAHDGGTSIQCPFCLKSTPVFSHGRIMSQNVSFFMQHLQKHQKKVTAKKCPRCALWFINKETLREHQINMHASQKQKSGLIPWTSSKSSLMVPRSKSDVRSWHKYEKNSDFANLTIRAPYGYKCKECKGPIVSTQHFRRVEFCKNSNCHYVTCCKQAMKNHTEVCTTLNASLPVNPLPQEMFCVCGYSDNEGNTLAKHLAECERKSAYSSVEAAKRAIKAHSMLDVLGLVRRPEEKQSTADDRMDVDESDDNKTDDEVDKILEQYKKGSENNNVPSSSSDETEKDSNSVKEKESNNETDSVNEEKDGNDDDATTKSSENDQEMKEDQVNEESNNEKSDDDRMEIEEEANADKGEESNKSNAEEVSKGNEDATSDKEMVVQPAAAEDDNSDTETEDKESQKETTVIEQENP